MNDSSSEIARIYPDTYYQQHRNSILFSIATCLICLPNVALNLDEAAFVESSSVLASVLVPWFIWLAAGYSTLHFYLEWRDHAKPHGLAVENAIAQVRADIGSMSSQIRDLTTIRTTAKNIEDLLGQFASPEMAQNQRKALSGIERGVSEVTRSFSAALRRDIASWLRERRTSGDLDERMASNLNTEVELHVQDLKARVDNLFTGTRLSLSDASIRSFNEEARRTRDEISKLRAEIGMVIAEPSWVTQQINLTKKWTAIRVWIVGFAPPLALWVLATVLFIDSHIGYPILSTTVGEPALRASSES